MLIHACIRNLGYVLKMMDELEIRVLKAMVETLTTKHLSDSECMEE